MAILAPRQIAPLSTATVTSQTPVLRWALASGTEGAQVDLCMERACGTVLTTFTASGSSGTPPSALSAGVYFWRARGASGGIVGTQNSAVWELWVGARSAPVNTSWGTILDVNGDGYADVIVGARGSGTAYVYLGGPSGLATQPATTLSAGTPTVNSAPRSRARGT